MKLYNLSGKVIGRLIFVGMLFQQVNAYDRRWHHNEILDQLYYQVFLEK